MGCAEAHYIIATWLLVLTIGVAFFVLWLIDKLIDIERRLPPKDDPK